ncbi:MAG: alcohol dehydrogenase catalytic domain-containing protein [Melioribacteraceae bacterium]|nr:alcohol dehydrogenase catalytic domain-containing protein [Melioribacteraceae bacterium]
MKAIRYTKYGPPEVLKLSEVDKPIPKVNEVLVKIKAASINSWDYDLLIGTNINRLITLGISKPKIKILGCDISGIVESIGKDVKDIKVGDEVFGDISGSNWGGFAEYV